MFLKTSLLTLSLLCSTTLVKAMDVMQAAEEEGRVNRQAGTPQPQAFSEVIEDQHLQMWLENPEDTSLLLCCKDPKTLSTVHAKVLASLPPFDTELKKASTPPLFQAYKQLILENKGLHTEFCRLLIEGDPLDYNALFLAMSCCDESSEIRNTLLKAVVSETDFDPTNFIELSKDPTQIPHLKKHLLALSFLNAIRGPAYSDKLNIINDAQCAYINQLLSKPTLEQKDIDYVLSQPVWPIFTGESVHLSLTLMTKLMQTVPSDRFDLDRLTQLARVRWSLYIGLKETTPDTLREGKPHYSRLQSYPICLPPFYERLLEIYEGQGNRAKYVEALDDMHRMFGKRDLNELLRIAELFFDAGEYTKALEIIVNTCERTIDKTAEPLLPFYFQRILIKAKTRELPGNIREILNECSKASWIETLKSEFKDDADSISIPLGPTYSSSTGSFSGIRTEIIKLCEVNDLEAADSLSKGDFPKALALLHTRQEDEVYVRGIQNPFNGQSVSSRTKKKVVGFREDLLLSFQSRPSVEECLYAALAIQLENPNLPNVVISYLRNRLSQRLVPQEGMFIKHLVKSYAPVVMRLLHGHMENNKKLEEILKAN